MNYLLHEKNFYLMPLTGWWIRKCLQSRATAVMKATAGLRDPDVSILIRSRNNSRHLKQLFADIRAQVFDGDIEIIVVDTESTDDSVQFARSQGATVIQLTQDEFTYPLALNRGFQAAGNPWVVTLVSHSGLSSKLFLKGLTCWAQDEKVGGVYSLPLVNWDASVWERLQYIGLPAMWVKPLKLRRMRGGAMGANCSILKRTVWEELGGYDERYAGGGEDMAMARSLLAQRITIVREPLCSVFHSHGLNLKHTLQQWVHWLDVGRARPRSFETAKVHARRPSLR
jgi:rhamnosyltransferase